MHEIKPHQIQNPWVIVDEFGYIFYLFYNLLHLTSFLNVLKNGIEPMGNTWTPENLKGIC